MGSVLLARSFGRGELGDDAAVLALVPALESIIGNRSWWMTLGWISVENQGRMACDRSIDDLGGECGYCQLDASEAAAVGTDGGTISRDPDASLQSCMDTMDRYGAKLVQLGVTPGTDAYWLLVKLMHSIGAGGTPLLLAQAAGAGVDVNDWAAVSAYGYANDDSLSRMMGHQPGYVSHWIDVANEVYDKGHALAAAAGVQDVAGGPGGSAFAYLVVASALGAIGLAGFFVWKRSQR